MLTATEAVDEARFRIGRRTEPARIVI